jgi:hypothetical protein
MNKSTGALAAAIAATLGSATAAQAATTAVTLNSVISYSGNGSSSGNITSSTATFEYDDVTNLLSQTGGTFNVRFTIVPATTLFRHSITGLVIGNGAAATGTTYTCTEGGFGTGVGASLCGNYNFGANFTNESTTSWGPGTAFAKTVGGDDKNLGPQQSILAYDGFSTLSWTGTQLQLSNAACNPAAPGNSNGCATNGGFNTGYTWVLEPPPTPTATDDSDSTTRNDAVTIDVLTNDTNLTVNPPTVTADATGTNATVGASIVVNPDNTISYTPNLPAGTAGPVTDTFTYTITSEDPDLTATVTVTVNNTVPSAGDGDISASTQGVTPAGVEADFTAPGTGGSLGDAPSTVSVTQQGTRGTAAVSGSTITYTVTDPTFFEGNDTFEYTITDNDGETTSAGTVTVTIPDIDPELADATVETTQDSSVDVDLTVTPGNGAPDEHLVAIESDASSGSCSLAGFTLTYTPDAAFTGNDSCTVRLTDADGDFVDAIIDFVVNSSGGLRDSSGGSSADWLLLSLFGASALIRRRRSR